VTRTGYGLLRSVLRDVGAFWCLLIAIRAIWLLRPDASGHPFATNVFDYWYKSSALEWLDWAPVAVPALVIGLALRNRHAPRSAPVILHALVGVAGICVLLMSILDMETMRFTGGHASLSLARMYGRPGAARDMLSMLRGDPGGPFLGVLLLALSLVWWIRRTIASAGAIAAAPPSPAHTGAWSRAWLAVGLAAGVTIIASVIAIRITGFRDWRLAPAVTVAARQWRTTHGVDLPAARLAEASARYQREWYDGASSSEAATWVFPRPDYPFFRTTKMQACARDEGKALPCDADGDADGWPLRQDCDDRDARRHQGTDDLPGDGIDQDCNGIDADPWNVLLVVLESFRGAGVGHLQPWGAEVADATPRLDALAHQGRFYTRTSANGVPSAIGFMTMNTGIEPHPSKMVARDFTNVALDGFPRVLGEHGYQTRFFSTARPEWDNFTFWLWRWCDAVVHQVDNPRDDRMFARAAKWLSSERDSRKPFFATVWTRINHFPFDGQQIADIVPHGLDVKDRAPHTMRWTDTELGRFLDSIRDEPWFAHTIVIVTGDHGYPLGEHGSYLLGEDLHGEATWVPLVIAGNHPELLRGHDDRPASHVDLAPTVFDLLGIDAANAFSGHSLAQPAGDPTVVGFLWPEISYARGDRHLLTSQPGASRGAGDELFSSADSRLDRTAIDLSTAARQSMMDAAQDRFFLTSWVYERNRILPAMPPIATRGQAIFE
jgi:hypothetical protein